MFKNLFKCFSVLAIGGWHDMYSNAVFRLVDNLPNCHGIIGPWSHDWPDVAVPGPQVFKLIKNN
jgi:hypothetical protein